MNNKKSKNIKEVIQNPFENPAKSIGEGLVKSFTSDLGKDGAKDFFDQMLGLGDFESAPSLSKNGEMAEGQEISLAKKENRAEKPKTHNAEPGLDYHRDVIHAEKRISHEQTREIETKIQEILVELKRLVSSSEVLQMTYKDIVVEERVVKPGKYHVSFFEWLLTVVRSARMKVEDSGAWLAAMKSKKGQKGYWNQFKKHGTSFGLSNERVVATQTG